MANSNEWILGSRDGSGELHYLVQAKGPVLTTGSVALALGFIDLYLCLRFASYWQRSGAEVQIFLRGEVAPIAVFRAVAAHNDSNCGQNR
jgi:hypothetical protein